MLIQKQALWDAPGEGETIGAICDRFDRTEPDLAEVSLGVHYAAYLKDELDKDPFDYTYARGRYADEFFMRQETLLPGLELAMEKMKRNAQAVIILKPEWAYGPHGCPPRIPPNSTVIFWVRISRVSDNFERVFPHMDIHHRRQISIQAVVDKCNGLHQEVKK